MDWFLYFFLGGGAGGIDYKTTQKSRDLWKRNMSDNVHNFTDYDSPENDKSLLIDRNVELYPQFFLELITILNWDSTWCHRNYPYLQYNQFSPSSF